MNTETIVIDNGLVQSQLVLGEKLSNLSKYIPQKNVIIITDTNVNSLYHSQFPDVPTVVLPTGEKNKTLETLDFIFQEFLKFEVDRSWFVVGIGGGIVCDTTGFAASIFMRGLDFGFVSTTLLSQVDASVGGKNGVNFSSYKNMVGVFAQPKFVLFDFEVLKTLPQEEIACGYAEIIKHALIKSQDYFDYLNNNADDFLAASKVVTQKAVLESVKIKAAVVQKDEKEHGERRLLNFGHTFAHAIENKFQWLHGRAVFAGMRIAINISVNAGLLSTDDRDTIFNLFSKYNIPEEDINVEDLLLAIRHDKKRNGDKIHFILLQGIGSAVVKEYSFAEIEQLIK